MNRSSTSAGETVSRWVGREWVPEALNLQRKGGTLSEIAEILNLCREAVVKALYTDVVKPKASDA